MNKYIDKSVRLLICLIAIYIVYYFISVKVFKGYVNESEGFLSFTDHNLASGEFPLAVDKPILYGDYNVKTPPYLSAFNASDIYKEYPIFPAHSTEINNIRYWTKPENGKCSRAELCGWFYDAYTEQHIPPPPPTPGWDKRINYYVEDY
jgi:hypothetical protein